MARPASLILLTLCAAASGAESSTSNKPWSDFVETNFPFYASVLDARKAGHELPTNNLSPRGLILNLGHGAWACFDTELLRIAAIWEGPGVSAVSMSQISYQVADQKATEGQERLPRLAGEPWLANGLYPGWQTGSSLAVNDPRDAGADPKEIGRGPLPPGLGQFRGLRLTGSGVTLEYVAAGAPAQERVEARMIAGRLAVQRHIRLERAPEPLWLLLGRRAAGLTNFSFVVANSPANPEAARLEERNGMQAVRIEASDHPVEFRVACGTAPGVWESEPVAPSAPRWPEAVETKGKLSAAGGAYVVDNIEIPTRNPWRRNVRLADLAFFPDGRAAGVTFDGDIWLISGLGGSLERIQWKRWASGFNEPLSLAIREGEVFVFDKAGVWRLRDEDGNGEADRYEMFCNAFTQTAETREYAQGMRLAPDGSFVIAKGGIQMASLGRDNGTVLRIAPDGKSFATLAKGLRSPFIGVHPKTGLVTASDQQGNYVPTTPLHIIEETHYYGFLSRLLPKERHPAPIAEPLTWIPYAVNASGASQVWLTGARLGPLNDSLIHIGYFRPEVFSVLWNRRAAQPQAAVVSLTRDLAFPPLNGAVNPADGQLYLTGFQIWGTTAKQISGLARLRHTGAESVLPLEIAPMDKGVLLRFGVKLDPALAANPAQYAAERWNYRRGPDYGSPHFKLDGSKGQETLTPSSAYLSRDGKSIFLGIPDMKPAMQMRVGWSLAQANGARFEQNGYFTPRQLTPFDPATEGFDLVEVNLEARPAVVQETPITIEEGKRLAELMGCAACHSDDGVTIGKSGPSWKGLFGSARQFADGSRGPADEAYLRESIREPARKVVRGYEKGDVAMPSYEGVATDAQIEALALYIKSL